MTAGTATDAGRRAAAALRGLGGWAIAILIGLGGFSFFVLAVGENPIEALRAMWESALVDEIGPGEVLVYATPVILAGLAVALPAQAGLWNLGGEGQIVIGVVFATIVSQLIPATTPTTLAIPLLLVGGALGGAAWAFIPAVLRISVNLNEAIASLLLSYVALRILDYLVNGPWKFAGALGQPQAEPLPADQRMPLLEWVPFVGGGRLHLGILIALGLAAVVYLVIRRTRWGFRARVVGGNPEAGRRAGLPVKRLLLGAMLAGGALAGIAGAVQMMAVEGNAKGGIAGLYGFLGFLVSWLVRHDPRWIVVAGIAIGAIVVGGDGLQIDAGLPAASINILLALMLLAVLGRRGRIRGAEG